MRFGVGTRVRETAGCRNNFKTWNERRGMVTVCAQSSIRSRAGGSVRSLSGISGTQKF